MGILFCILQDIVMVQILLILTGSIKIKSLKIAPISVSNTMKIKSPLAEISYPKWF